MTVGAVRTEPRPGAVLVAWGDVSRHGSLAEVGEVGVPEVEPAIASTVLWSALHGCLYRLTFGGTCRLTFGILFM